MQQRPHYQAQYLTTYLSPQQMAWQERKALMHDQLRSQVYVKPYTKTVVTHHSPQMVTTRTTSTPTMVTHTTSRQQIGLVQVQPQVITTQTVTQPPVQVLPVPMMQTTTVNSHAQVAVPLPMQAVPMVQVATNMPPQLPMPMVQHVQQQPVQVMQTTQLPPPIFTSVQLPPPILPYQVSPPIQTHVVVQQSPPLQVQTVKHETVTIIEPRKEKDPPYLSLNCDGHRNATDPVTQKKYTEYKVIIESNIAEYQREKSLWKRYTDFEELHRIIKQHYAHISIPAMPAKHYFSQFDEGVLREREQAFDEILNVLALDPSNTALIDFISKSNS